MISRAVTEHLDHFHKRMGCSHWQRWCPYIKPAIERSKTDWMKTAGKQRFRGMKASLYAYLKFSPMIYISVSILILVLTSKTPLLFYIGLTEIYKVTIACFIPTISVGSTLTHVRFYYLDDPVHLLVSCAKLWNRIKNMNVRIELLAPLPRKEWSRFRTPSFWRHCRGLFEFGQLTVHLVAQIR